MAKEGYKSISNDIPIDLEKEWSRVCDSHRFNKGKLFSRLIKLFLSWDEKEQLAFHQSPDTELDMAILMTKEKCQELIDERIKKALEEAGVYHLRAEGTHEKVQKATLRNNGGGSAATGT